MTTGSDPYFDALHEMFGGGAGSGIERVTTRIAEVQDDPGAYRTLRALRSVAIANTPKLRRTYQRQASEQPPMRAVGLLAGGGNIPQMRQLLRARWGEDFLDAPVTLRRLRGLPPARLIGAPLADWLYRQRDRPEIDRDTWQRRQTWGRLANVYLVDLLLLAARGTQRGKAELVAAIEATIGKIVDGSQLPELRHAMKTSGVLICGSHCGAFQFGRARLVNAFPDMLTMGVASEGEGRVTVQDPVRALYQLTKHLRQPGNIGIIGGDGAYGEAGSNIDLLGQSIPFAPGPAATVHGAKCAAFFFLARWEGERVLLDFVPAPMREPGMKASAWNERWLAAYRDHLATIIRGDPENQRGTSGVWGKIERALEAAS